MIRVKISNFIKKYKNKIYNLGRKVIIVAVVVFAATIILSSLSNEDSDDTKDISNVYRPTDTIIQGSDISYEQYEQDSNLVNKFLEYCNNRKVEEAYNLLSNECKEEAYPTLDRFKENYYNYIFNRKRECNLQAWISTSQYTIYRVRYTNNMLSTGTYDENDVYEDYLTLNKKNKTEKISIGNFIDSEECNIVTKKDGIEFTVKKIKTYLSFQEFEIDVLNLSEKTIMIDNLKSSKTIRLKASTGTIYDYDNNRLFSNDFIIGQNQIKTIQLRFRKSFNANNSSKEIEFKNIIKDYYTYTNNEASYTDITNITVEVGD